jgi:hypothetical protein
MPTEEEHTKGFTQSSRNCDFDGTQFLFQYLIQNYNKRECVSESVEKNERKEQTSDITSRNRKGFDLGTEGRRVPTSTLRCKKGDIGLKLGVQTIDTRLEMKFGIGANNAEEAFYPDSNLEGFKLPVDCQNIVIATLQSKKLTIDSMMSRVFAISVAWDFAGGRRDFMRSALQS